VRYCWSRGEASRWWFGKFYKKFRILTT
jgi:hypothetical protein